VKGALCGGAALGLAPIWLRPGLGDRFAHRAMQFAARGRAMASATREPAVR
jgi:hypothetical protein